MSEISFERKLDRFKASSETTLSYFARWFGDNLVAFYASKGKPSYYRLFGVNDSPDEKRTLVELHEEGNKEDLLCAYSITPFGPSGYMFSVNCEKGNSILSEMGF